MTATLEGGVVSITPRPHFTSGKDRVRIVEEAGWAPGPVWTSGKSRPDRDSIPDRPAHSSVAIPTELSGPERVKYLHLNLKALFPPGSLEFKNNLHVVRSTVSKYLETVLGCKATLNPRD
jgi:hypothetical protein